MDGRVINEVLMHMQTAAGYAEYLPGGKQHDLVVSEHAMTEQEAADNVREQLALALAALGGRA